jgi:toxin ParE1/3/4
MTVLELAYRAHAELAKIESYSIDRWGQRVADRYIADIADALLRLKEEPRLLRTKNDVSARLKFYLVNKHFLVCDCADDCIFVLSIIHVSRDLPVRIAELEPALIEEAKWLQKKMTAKRGTKRSRR